tara:strand:- start:106 stop:366 length:261 start_codon:yes stop_codon:yes gene_type:complete
MRTTSKIAYDQLKDSGGKQTQEQRIVEILRDKGMSMSLREISALTGYEINAVSGRVNTLKKEGRVLEGTRRKCFITNRLITPVIAL